MATIQPQAGIMDIALYQGGQSALPGHSDVIKLSSNENPYGASPKALEAFTRAARRSQYRALEHPPECTHNRSPMSRTRGRRFPPGAAEDWESGSGCGQCHGMPCTATVMTRISV